LYVLNYITTFNVLLPGLSKNKTLKEATEVLEKNKDLTKEESKMKASRATQVLQILDE